MQPTAAYRDRGFLRSPGVWALGGYDALRAGDGGRAASASPGAAARTLVSAASR